MINLIVTSSGYVESNQVARIFWRAHEVDKHEPKDALKSLANDLATAYYREALWDWKGHFDCHVSEYRHDLEKVDCPECKRPLRIPFVVDNFMQFITNLAGNTCDDMGDELDFWWPYGTYEDVHVYKPEETLLVEEWFEKHLTASIDPSLLKSKEDKEGLEEYIKENPYKVTQRPSGFWEAETIYTHLDEDESERVN